MVIKGRSILCQPVTVNRTGRYASGVAESLAEMASVAVYTPGVMSVASKVTVTEPESSPGTVPEAGASDNHGTSL